MDVEIKKMKKKENIMTVLLVLLIFIEVFIAIFVYANKDEYYVVEEPPVIDENTYIKLEEIDITDYSIIYDKVNIKKISFVNIPEVLISNFYVKQDEIIGEINDNLVINKDFIDKYNIDNNITNYTVNSKIDSNIIYDLEDNVLSLLYLVEDTVDYVGLKNHIINIFIDVSTNTLMNNDMILERYDFSKELICSNIFDRIVNEHDGDIIDKDTNEKISTEEILNKKNEYVTLLMDNFDTYIYPYLNDGELYFKFNKNDIASLLFNEKLISIQYSTLKL